MKRLDTVIVGAGVAGLHLAHKITGHTCIVEKARGVGGRIASRRFGSTFFNQGISRLDFYSGDKVNNYAKELSQGLSIQNSFRVHRIYADGQGFCVLSDNHQMLKTRKIIFTAPAPQVKEILDRSQIIANFLDGVQYESEIKLLCKNPKNIDQRLKLDELKVIGEDIYKLYSSKKYDKESIRQLLVEAEETYIHYWRYSQVIRSIDSKYQLALSSQNIFLAGDYFSLGGISATLSSVTNLVSHL